MIYLNNDTNNSIILTLSEGCISGNTEFLFNLKSASTNKEFYFICSSNTSDDRYDQIDLLLTGNSYTYYNSIPNQIEDQYHYKVYELLTGVTTGITINELTGLTIDFSTALTRNNIIEEGKIYVSATTNLNIISSTYSANTTYSYYK